MKVLTVVGTRPEIIKLSLVIKELEDNVEHVLVHTGQNYDYELNQIFFNDLNIKKPDHFLEANEDTPAKTVGSVLLKIDPILEKEKPDALLIYGDTNSCLCAIAAKKRRIPIFHMEAGNRCFDPRVPEESNRKVIDHLSDINIVHSEHARRYLLDEGLHPERIFKSGSPMKEVLNFYSENIKSSKVLNDLKLKSQDYFLLSCHREENVDSESNFKNLLSTLDELTKKYNKKVIFSAHPRTRKKLEEIGYTNKNKMIEIMKPLGFFDYMYLQVNAYCTLSDSGTITEESSILNFPAVTIRQAHERPEGMDELTVLMSDLYAEAVIRAIDFTVKNYQYRQPIEDYKADNVSKKTVGWILSYTDFVNRFVWRKNL